MDVIPAVGPEIPLPNFVCDKTVSRASILGRNGGSWMQF